MERIDSRRSSSPLNIRRVAELLGSEFAKFNLFPAGRGLTDDIDIIDSWAGMSCAKILNRLG